jgi:hypothetical protein
LRAAQAPRASEMLQKRSVGHCGTEQQTSSMQLFDSHWRVDEQARPFGCGVGVGVIVGVKVRVAVAVGGWRHDPAMPATSQR